MFGPRLALAASLLLGAASCGGHAAVVPVQAPEFAKITSQPVVPVSVAASEEGVVVPISASDAVWGSRNAAVSMVIFGDFQCPYTAKVLPTLRALEEKYGPNDLRVAWKDEPLPFHAQARPIAEAGAVVLMLGQSDAFWKFWEQALAHHTDLTPASAEAWATAAGVEPSAYRRMVDAHAGKAKVDADLATAEKLHVSGTPTFFVNGVAVLGAQPVARFSEVIDAQIVKAKERLAAGIAPDALYADLAKANWKDLRDDSSDDGPQPDDSTTVWAVPLGDAPGRGGQAPLVTIVEFSDYQCPFCKLVEPTLKEIRQRYGDKVRVVWKDEPLPFHPHATSAAELAREAQAEKGECGFWAAHDAIFDAQPKLEDADLVALARKLGLDAAKAKAAIASKKYEAHIQADVDLAGVVGANGTPCFFINGRKLAGAQPLERFEEIIDQEIRRAEEMLSAGVDRKGLYDAVMRAAAKGAGKP